MIHATHSTRASIRSTSVRSTSVRSTSILATILFATGCLGPQVSDDPMTATAILPANAAVPPISANAIASAQLAANDGVAGVIVRQTGFSNGGLVHVWDFGPAPDFAAPLFMLVERDPDNNLVRVAHNTIIEAIPGDPGYSPFWSVFMVEITTAYRGEILASVEAVNEAVARGLVRTPVLQTFAVNCPAVGGDVRVEIAAGQTVGPNANFYYRGQTVPYFDFGHMPLVSGVHIPEAPRYRLRREGQEPLSELVRNVDMDDDGDTADTNDLYVGDPRATTSTPRLRAVDVVVPVATSSIDTSHDEAISGLRDAAQLFAPGPVPGVVIGYQPTSEVHNFPGQPAMGGL